MEIQQITKRIHGNTLLDNITHITATGTSNQQNYTINSAYYNTPGTHYFRREISANTNSCAGFSDVVILTVSAPATADAGPDQTVCATSPDVTLAGVIGGSATIGTWTGGTGSFSPDANTLNAVYTPSAAEITAGTVTLTLTTDNPTGACNAATNSMVITINQAPSITTQPSAPSLICENGGVYTMTVAASGTNLTYQWRKNGTPLTNTAPFSNVTSATLTITNPSIADGNQLYDVVVSNGSCSPATSSGVIFTVSPGVPAAPDPIQGTILLCEGATNLTYNINAVPNAEFYTWTVPTGWNIISGQGTNSIQVNAGSAGQNGNITVSASNTCGTSANPSQTVDIFPVNATNNTGFTNNTTKSSGTIQVNLTNQRGYLKFPLSAIPSGVTITGTMLTLINNGSTPGSTSDNDVKALSLDPVTASASALYSGIGAQGTGTSYNTSPWNSSGALVLPLNSTANTNIQNNISARIYCNGIGKRRHVQLYFRWFCRRC